MLKRNKDEVKSVILTIVSKLDTSHNAAVQATQQRILDTLTDTDEWRQFAAAAKRYGLPLPTQHDLAYRIANDYRSFETGAAPEAWASQEAIRLGWVPTGNIRIGLMSHPTYRLLDTALDSCKLPWTKLRPLLYGMMFDLQAATDSAGVIGALTKFCETIK